MKDNVAEILRKAIEKKPVRVSIGEVIVDPARNVREPDVSTWGLDGIAEDIALNGQKEPVVLEKVDDKYYPIRGFRRTSAIKLNADKKVVDPTTGRIFDTVLAWVIDDKLSEKDRVAIMVDQGNSRGLQPHELLYAIQRMDKTASTDAEIAITCRGLLDQYFPLKREVKDDKDYADYRRGVVQNFVAAARGPLVMFDKFVLKLKRVQTWPTADEVRVLYADFKKEKDADKASKISVEKPGKEWLKKWDAFVAKKQAAPAGKSANGGIVAFNRDAMSKVADTAKSRILRVIESCHLRKINKPEEALAAIDEMLMLVEKGEIKPAAIEKVLDGLTAETEEIVAKTAAA